MSCQTNITPVVPAGAICSSKVRLYGRRPSRRSVSPTKWRFVRLQYCLSVAASRRPGVRTNIGGGRQHRKLHGSTTGDVQTDTSSGDVYVAWASKFYRTALVTTASVPFSPAFFDSNVIKMVTSTDGGQSFNAPVVMAVNAPNFSGLALYGPTTERDAEPAITISQGRLSTESGQQGDAGVPGGQVTVGWVDTAVNEHQVLVNSVNEVNQTATGQLPAREFGFNGSTGFINFGSTTDFTTGVQIPANQVATLTSLSLTVDITDSTDANLGLKLIAPGGESIYLFTNQSVGARASVSGASPAQTSGLITDSWLEPPSRIVRPAASLTLTPLVDAERVPRTLETIKLKMTGSLLMPTAGINGIPE